MRRLLVLGTLPILATCVSARAEEDPVARHVRDLRAAHRDVTIAVEAPFVVIGNGTPDEVRRARGVVRWASTALRRQFFRRSPEQLYDVWLLSDQESYVATAVTLTGEEPTTPYGFAWAEPPMLVMDISTGSGTLVHELVHPFIRADFPGCPPWFNEGLASLFEQSGERDGRIVGFTNWRLAGLQDAIRTGTLPPFEELFGADDETFYDRDPGTNYAQARYLCLWLQEQGLLERYYAAFRDAADDPTGRSTLVEVADVDDLAAFQARWEAWVLTLTA